MERMIESPAFRFFLAVAVLLLARAALRHPPVPAEHATPTPISRQLDAPHALVSVIATPVSTAAPPLQRIATPQPTPSDPTEAVWRDAMKSYGQQLGYAVAEGREYDFQRIWADIGKYFRTKGVSGPMFQQWMDHRGWPPDEQTLMLTIAGYSDPRLMEQ
ncbi:MAG: hypothetical protein NTZ05_02635 [Chloroflexi bacterium]|nr:hypothetical protein [Chloroflexota bacterium]